MTPGGSRIEDMVLKVYIKDSEQLEQLKQRLTTDRQLLPFKKASMKLGVPTLDFVGGADAELDPSTCDKVWDGSVFFDSPWYHNVFHLHAKNILPTALVLATSPPLVSGVGPCTDLPCKEQLPHRTLIHYVAERGKPLMLANVQLAFFDQVRFGTLMYVEDDGLIMSETDCVVSPLYACLG